jgi:hypothetical protein
MAPPRKQVVDGLDDNPGAIAILDVLGMDRDTYQQAGRVGHNMALATFDFFGRIIPSWSTAFGGLDRLAVDDASRWTGFAFSRLAGLSQQFLIREKRRGDPRRASAEGDETVRVGHNITRIALAFEAALWLEACGVEAT